VTGVMIIKDVRDKHHKSVAEIRDSDNFVNISSFFNRVEETR
jgi:predicted glycosyltransferase